MVEPHSSNFIVFTTNYLGVRIFRKFTVVYGKTTVFRFQGNDINDLQVPIFRIFMVDSCILGSAADRDMSRIYRRFEYGDQQKRIAQSNARRSEKTLWGKVKQILLFFFESCSVSKPDQSKINRETYITTFRFPVLWNIDEMYMHWKVFLAHLSRKLIKSQGWIHCV